MNALEKLRETTDAILAKSDPMKIMDQWMLAGRLLGRFPVDKKEADRVLRDRDAAGLDAIVRRLEQPEKAPAPAAVEVDPEEMDRALRAFRKRLKVSRLADESKLGGRYTSGGKKSGIDAMQPPSEFGPEVWRALERAGKIRHTGGGFYALA